MALNFYNYISRRCVPYNTYKQDKMSQPKSRVESDTIGQIEVPADRYFGAQTMRCLNNFPCGEMAERMPVTTEAT